MLKKIRNFIVLTSVALGLSLAPTLPAFALFDGSANQACGGVQLDASDAATCAPSAQSSKKVDSLVALSLNIFSVIAGIIAVIMIIIGGLKYITSQGESANVTSAKNTLLYAVIGIVIVAFAQIIVKFVIHKTTV